MRDTLPQDWSSYWAHAGGPVGEVQMALTAQRPAAILAAFWQSVFQTEFAQSSTGRLLDMACGAGVVIAHAVEGGQGGKLPGVELHCMDYSHAAVKLAARQIDGVKICGTAADARNLPYADQAFDLIVSQFGLEYAGAEGFREAARLLAPEGELHLVLHLSGGPIHKECLANLNLLQQFERSRLLELCRRALVIAEQDDSARETGSTLAGVMRSLHLALCELRNQLLARPGGVAHAHIGRLLHDVPLLIERRLAYAPGAALSWVDAQTQELTGFSRRMQAMCAAAMDAEAIHQTKALLRGAGLRQVCVAQLRAAPAANPIAWTLSARAP